MKVYPSWRYHKTLEPRLVRSEAEDQAIGPGWADTPAAFKDAPEAKEEAQTEPAPRKRGRKPKAVSA